MIYASKVKVTLEGPVDISYNSARHIILCEACSLLFSNNIRLESNTCYYSLISLHSEQNYIKVMEYSNIEISHNKLTVDLFILESGSHRVPYPFCGFQYITSKRNSSSAYVNHYTITMEYNYVQGSINFVNPRHVCRFYHNHLSHCEWIPTSVFYNNQPGPVNQQILLSIPPTSLHYAICFCSHNITNCSVDVLGSVHPGQLLQVDLCVPNSTKPFILYVETHNAHLPPSPCKVAHQTEVLQTFTHYPKVFNFTIVTDLQKNCELFLTASPCLYDVYEAFYVEILPCPVGFELKNGVCDCDPYLKKE